MYIANYSYRTFLFCLTKEAVYNLTFTWLVNGQALLNKKRAPKNCFPLLKKSQNVTKVGCLFLALRKCMISC